MTLTLVSQIISLVLILQNQLTFELAQTGCPTQQTGKTLSSQFQFLPQLCPASHLCASNPPGKGPLLCQIKTLRERKEGILNI